MRVAGLFFVSMTAVVAQQAAPESGSPFLSIPPAPAGLRVESRLPPFQAKDITGRTWRPEDLRGKLTLIYFWSTFLARAVDANHSHLRELDTGLPDLPEVQRFYDKARHSRNIQVLTFCRDHDYTHAPEYGKESKYSFPVIADWVLIQKLFPQGGSDSPYWIVDREGRLLYPRSWSLGRVLYEIELAASRNSDLPVNQP